MDLRKCDAYRIGKPDLANSMRWDRELVRQQALHVGDLPLLVEFVVLLESD